MKKPFLIALGLLLIIAAVVGRRWWWKSTAEVAALPWEELHPEERELVKQWRTQ